MKIDFRKFCVCIIFAFLHCNTPLLAESCGSACVTTSDCPAACPVCEGGFCVDCGALGDELSCTDSGSGAPLSCYWDTASNCTAFASLPAYLETGGFGSRGVVIQNINSGIEEARAGAYYSNGRLVVVGYYFNGGAGDFATTRFYPDGTIDTTFGSGGQILTDIAGGDDGAHAVAIDYQGRVVVAGKAFASSTYNFAVVRYGTDGVLDTKFGSSGIVVQESGFARGDFARGVDVNSSSFRHVIVAGYANVSGGGVEYNAQVMRLQSNGVLDTKFGSGGKTLTDFNSGQNDLAYGVLFRTDNRVMIFGRTQTGTNTDFIAARYATNGNLDTTFASAGMAQTDFNTNEDVALAAAFDSFNRLLVIGKAFTGSNSDTAIARYLSNGNLDSKFDTDGKQTFAMDTDNDDVGRGIAAVPPTGILTAGRTYNGTDWDLFTMRLQSNGALDTRYDTDGKYTLDISGDADEINNLAWDGRYYYAAIGGSNNGANLDFSISRIGGKTGLAKSGDRNEFVWGSSGTDSGIIRLNFSSYQDTVYDVALQSDGRLVSIGVYGSNRNALARTNADGTLDTKFGSTFGWTDSGSGNSYEWQYAIALDDKNRLVSTGRNNYLAVSYRFATNGNADTNYGGIDFGSITQATTTLYYSNLNTYYVVGMGYNKMAAVGRVHTNTTLDSSFGSDTGVAFASTKGEIGDDILSADFDSDGGILVCGPHSCGGFLARFESNGAIDSGFGTTGYLELNSQAIYNCSYDNHKRIMAVGMQNNNCAAWRLHSNGILDTKFGSAGEVQIDWGSGTDICSGKVTQSGKLMIGGYSEVGNVYRYTRLLSSGAIDAPFHSNPMEGADTFTGGSERMHRTVVTDNDMLWIVGESFASNADWAIQSIFP